MFGFLFGWMRRQDKVEKLRRRWTQDPSPKLAEKLACVLIERHEINQALALLKRACRMYPRAERIASYYQKVMHLKSSDEIRALRQALATHPSAQIHARLSELYRFLGHFEEALEIAHEGVKAYPDYAGNHLAIGRVYFSRFSKTASAHDGRKTASYLEKAYALDPQNVKTIYHLANLYLRVGHKPKAETYLAHLVEIMPSESRILALQKRCHQIPQEDARAGTDYFARYEARRMGQAGMTSEGPKRGADVQTLQKQVASAGHPLSDIPGVQGAYVFDPQEKLLNHHSTASEPGSMQAVAQGILKAVRVNARRMTIGAFSQGHLVSGKRKIFFYDFNDMSMLIFADKQVRNDLIHRKVTEYVEDMICETAAS